MAHIPADFGGNRQFIADANATNISTAVGDMAALNLQLIHCLREAVDDGADGAARRIHVDRIAADMRRVLAASDVSKTRELAVRELRPVTRVPNADWGANVNIANIKMFNITTFLGSSADTIDVVRWIGRVLSLAEANNLTLNAARGLLVQGSSGSAASYIEHLIEEGRSLHQVVQQLEMRYGKLRTPEEARVTCNTLIRKDNEELSEYIDRLRLMARMACRMEADDVVRRRQMEELVSGNIRRVLPTTVRESLAERVTNRSLMGLPAFTARELEKECLDLERARIERRAPLERLANKPGRIMNCRQDVLGDGSSYLTEDESSADEVDVEDEAMYNLVLQIKNQQRHYAGKGQAVDPKKVYRKAFQQFNREHPPPKFPRGGHHGARMAADLGGGQRNLPGNPNSGPPNQLDSGVKRTINELLAMAGVARGSCIQCGNSGHYMHQDLCVLKDKVLMDRACAKCGQGLHSADDCPRVYQKQYVSQAPLVNPVQAENLVKE